MPETVDEIDPSWLAGYDGVHWDGGRMFWSPSLWKPAYLSKGDTVGALVSPTSLMIFVNGIGVVQEAFSIPCDKPLYGILDLVGATTAITVRGDAEPPRSLGLAKQFRRDPITVDFNPLETAVDVGRALQADGFTDMRGFHTVKKGKMVHLAADGTTAVYCGGDEDLHGGIIGDGSLPLTHEGAYFEVRIDKVGTDSVDGLSIGVTDKSPDELPYLPETLDAVDKIWLVGMSGDQWDGRTQTWSEISWYPKDLKVGDRVGVLVDAKTGDMSIFVNGLWRSKGPSGIPCDKPLFAAIDLIGNTDGVSFIKSAKHPSEESREPSIQAQITTPSEGFSRTALGKNVSLSADGRSAVRSPKVDTSMLNGVTIGGSPVRFFEGRGHYFEITVDGVLARQQPDGLAIGVTTRRPEELREVPATADQLSPTWLVGFDGATWNSSTTEWGLCEWDPRGLVVGDRVGVLVDLRGNISIFVSGTCVEEDVARNIPIEANQPLYAVVDLIGIINAVSLLLDVQPPFKAPGQRRSGPELDAPLRGFYKRIVGDRVRIHDDGSSAHCDSDGSGADRTGGVLIGDGPLLRAKDGSVGFEIAITTVKPSTSADGLAVGFTSRAPWEVRKCPSSADQIDPSWLVGFDGAFWDGVQLRWDFSPWMPLYLGAGDVVCVRLTAQAELEVAVNNVLFAVHSVSCPKGALPLDRPLYALVDLMGSTHGVSLVKQVESLTPSYGKTPPVLTSFDTLCKGSCISLSENCDSATFVGPAACASNGVAFSNGLLAPHGDRGRMFCSTILELRKTGDHAVFAVGVTGASPSSLKKAPRFANEVFPCWLVGFDGAFYDGIRGEWGLSDFSSVDLRVNDVITVIVTRCGELQVLVNGVRRASHAFGIPTIVQLYALVDLAGCIGGLSINTSKEVSVSRLNVVAEKTLSGFNRTQTSGLLNISDDGLMASRSEGPPPTGKDDAGLVLIGDGVLPAFVGSSGAVYFRVVVMDILTKPQERGFALGVTTVPPDGLAKLPPLADMVNPSWLVGFDGAFWDGFRSEWDLSDFNGASVQAGDVITAIVTPSPNDEIQILVNGTRRAVHKVAGLPPPATAGGQRRLYALADMAGHVASITMQFQSAGAVSGAKNASTRLPAAAATPAKASAKKRGTKTIRHSDGRSIRVPLSGA
eukprot:TRINITY_DN40851_c0_g2_i1.p1 TRINITY_DN40851_c0_g2~~TRINITY_DN40851_c0_g2_i1.p1  ORF type:complete len:1205 (+),score=177.64 TRINITY_DN40851_c0_g2_i1:140-3616(+)